MSQLLDSCRSDALAARLEAVRAVEAAVVLEGLTQLLERVETQSAPRSAPIPKPSRAELAGAEQALTDAEAAHAAELQRFEDEVASIGRHETEARREFDAMREKLGAARQAESDAYDDAMSHWGKSQGEAGPSGTQVRATSRDAESLGEVLTGGTNDLVNPAC